MGEVTKYLVYNARKRGTDSASMYFKRTENIAGVKVRPPFFFPPLSFFCPFRVFVFGFLLCSWRALRDGSLTRPLLLSLLLYALSTGHAIPGAHARRPALARYRESLKV